MAAVSLAAVVLLGLPQASTAQQSAEGAGNAGKTISGYHDVPGFGGPTSVSGQVKSDHEIKQTPYRFEGLTRSLQPYYDFKARVKKDAGLAFGADYNALVQHASRSLGKDSAAGGVFRFFGTWALVGRDSPDAGALTYKVENRHRLGSIAPQALASQIGYAGLTAPEFSDADWLLTNLYWHQSFDKNRWEFTAGIVDTSDYVDVYGFGNPWTDFLNQVFQTDPTIATPSQGLGMALRTLATDNVYVLVGLADANGDPAHPGDSVHSFFDEAEYFKHVELGWISSWAKRFEDNIHLTAWQADARTAAGVPSGWGAAFSYSQRIDSQWLPFLRLGYSDGGGGALLERSVGAGIGYFTQARSDLLGIGLNWGRPSEKTFGPGLRDQTTAEIFYRIQLMQHATITPAIQYLRNPALNPDTKDLWVVGLRARLSF